jgi:hypothetical protein
MFLVQLRMNLEGERLAAFDHYFPHAYSPGMSKESLLRSLRAGLTPEDQESFDKFF